MAKRSNNGNHSANKKRVAEMHNQPEHAHLTASHSHDKQDHLTGHEHSSQALEHSQQAHPAPMNGELAHLATATRARELWQLRGCPEGTADEDWYNASQELRARPNDQQE